LAVFGHNYLYPFTPSSGQGKNSRKIRIFSFLNPAKQIVPCDGTVKEISYEWSHHRISSSDSKVRPTLPVYIIDSGSERVKFIRQSLETFGDPSILRVND